MSKRLQNRKRGAIYWFFKWIDILEQGLVLLTSVILIGMMLVSDISVIGRYLFDKPIPASFELIVLMFVIVCLAPQGYVQRVHGHIGVEIVKERISPRKGAFLELIVGILLFSFLALFSWQCLEYTINNWYEVSIGVIRWPYWPALIFLPLGFGVCCLRVFVQIFENTSILLRKKEL